LMVGFYSPDDLVRLPILLDGVEQPGDQLELDEIEITP